MLFAAPCACYRFTDKGLPVWAGGLIAMSNATTVLTVMVVNVPTKVLIGNKGTAAGRGVVVNLLVQWCGILHGVGGRL
jgi:hypothetical protein